MIRLGVLSLLMLQAVLFAVAPAPLLMLAGHEHAVIGVVTPEQWRKHQEAHLRAAQGRATDANHAGKGTSHAQIISTGDLHSSLSILQSPVAFTVPDCHAVCFWVQWSEPVMNFKPASPLSYQDTPHPPPRGTTV